MNLLNAKRKVTKEAVKAVEHTVSIPTVTEPAVNVGCGNEEVLIELNKLLQFITQLDYVKEVIVETNHQNSMISNIAASSEELSASTEEISSFVQESYKVTNGGVDTLTSSIDKINMSFKRMEVTINKTYRAQEAMKQVNDSAKKIDNMVGIIKNVADQTNLLALNASIEAARAGEQGRGFSVVANEIKKLAESTKEQVNFIYDTVNALSKEITNTTNSLNEATESYNNSKDYIDDAISSINGMNEVLGGISNSFLEISSNIQEQTAASEEIASSLQIISEKNDLLKENTEKTGKAFYDISKAIDEIRLFTYQHADNLPMKESIEICICDHLMWKWRVYNMILGNVTLDENTVGTHLTCRLGKWVSNQNQSNMTVRNIIKELEQPHSAVHDLAKKAIKQYNGKDINGAEQTLKKLEEASQQVVGLLRKIQSIVI